VANFHTYGVCFALMLAMALCSQDRRVIFAGCVLAGNWVLWSAAVLADSFQTPWVWALALDCMSALLVMRAVPLGLSFCCLMVLHAMLGGGYITEAMHYERSGLVGWLQWAGVSLWAVSAMRRRAAA